jgi:hypothetical protein
MRNCICGDSNCRYEVGPLYWHEAVDRSHVALDHFYEYVAKHPVILHDKDLLKAADDILQAMNNFYQMVSRKKKTGGE